MDVLTLYLNRMPIRFLRVLELLLGLGLVGLSAQSYLTHSLTGMADILQVFLALALISTALSSKKVKQMDWEISQQVLYITTVSLFKEDTKAWQGDSLSTRLLKPEKRRPLELTSKIRWKVFYEGNEVAEIKPSLLVSKAKVKSGYEELRDKCFNR